MKNKEKRIARALRKKGWSINEIRKELRVAKSSVSIWVRDIKLTKSQKEQLSERGIKKDVIERRRATRLSRENKRRQKITERAKKQIRNISGKELFLIGVSLYWAEGGKTQRGLVRLSNCDSYLIQVMMQFFRKICKVPNSKFRGHIHLHPHLDDKRAERYWSKVSGIPSSQFFKTSQQHNKASKGKKDSLPYGTFSIYVCNTELFLKIKGWTEGLYEKVI